MDPGPRHWEIFVRLCRESAARGNLVPDAWEAWSGFAGEPWEMALEITDRGDGGREIRLRRQGPLPGLPSWTLDEPLVWVHGGKGD